MIGELGRYLRILGPAARILAVIEARARAIPEPELRCQALLSLGTKKFHCWGAASLALGVPRDSRPPFLRAVIALQTISDYLDNLADRGRARSVGEVRRLHRAMTDALTPGRKVGAYYDHPREDVYLPFLVAMVQDALSALPAYPPLSRRARALARRYGQLQALKHLHPASRREEALMRWERPRRRSFLLWWERAATAGSTLPLFGLLAGAFGDRTAGIWSGRWGRRVAALHILLDYAIDRDEDRREGDYNLTSPAGSMAALARRMGALGRTVARREDGGALPPALRLVVVGLWALYLSDRKALRLRCLPLFGSLIQGGGSQALFVWGVALAVRATLLRRLERLS